MPPGKARADRSYFGGAGGHTISFGPLGQISGEQKPRWGTSKGTKARDSASIQVSMVQRTAIMHPPEGENMRLQEDFVFTILQLTNEALISLQAGPKGGTYNRTRLR